MSGRAYLDWNATAPLRPEARAAMLSALDVAGNPSSVHGEGRAARAIVERARAEVAAAFGADGAEVVFTSGATEAAALALAGRELAAAEVEHDAVLAWCEARLPVDASGAVRVAAPAASTLQLASGETGIVQDLPDGLAAVDAVQGFGKLPVAFNWMGAEMAFVSGHKIGGPKGVGALVLRRGIELRPLLRGGGQEMGRRAGTENVAAIAGFGAAATAGAAELAAGAWARVATLRDAMEAALADGESDTIFVGKDRARLPNTSCIVTPGWKGETQVMQLDLAGFAVSAGSACSSGKVRASRALRAMGFGETEAASAIRVSLGPETREDEVARFVETWLGLRKRQRNRAA